VCLQQPVDRSFRDKVLLLVGEPNGQFARRQLWELTRYAYDNAGDLRAMALREKESGRLSLVLELSVVR
jgi:hypothetical protein